MFPMLMFAQPKINSPYSFYGLGDFFVSDFQAVHTSGGLSASFTDPYHVNVQNPASLASLKATAFEVGIDARHLTQKDGSNTNKVWNGNINYLSLGFPLINPVNEILDNKTRDFYWGMNMSLMPYTQVGYDINDLVEVEGTNGMVERRYIGEGGTYKFTWGNGANYKNISLGLNLSYMFGKSEYTRELNFEDPRAFREVFVNNISIKGISWNAGLLYKLDLGKKNLEEDRAPTKSLTFGITANPSISFNTINDEFNQRLFSLGNSGEIDTISYLENIEGKGTLPGRWSVGVSYKDGLKWRLGVNLQTEAWSKYENEAKPELLADSWVLSLGGSFRPDINAFESFYKTLDYRFGVSFGKDPRQINNKQLDQFNVSFGVGVPFFPNKKISFFNFGVDIGTFGISEQIKNNYVRFSAGFTLNDNEWFRKRKFY